MTIAAMARLPTASAGPLCVTACTYVVATASTTRHIAGEPAELLARGLPCMRAMRQPDGSVVVSVAMELEVWTARQRPIERYGADPIELGKTAPLDETQAGASVRLVSELAGESDYPIGLEVDI